MHLSELAINVACEDGNFSVKLCVSLTSACAHLPWEDPYQKYLHVNLALGPGSAPQKRNIYLYSKIFKFVSLPSEAWKIN